MNANSLKGCLAIALTVALQPLCFADDAVSTTTVKSEGPPVVLDSYMKPTVVQTKETTDANGNVEKSVAPIIQERHEHVMLPSSETTTTMTEHTGTSQTVKTEATAVARRTFRSAPRRKVAHRVRHHRRACVAAKPKSVAVAQKTVVEKKVIEPTVIQRQDTTVEKATVIERKDPALNNQ